MMQKPWFKLFIWFISSFFFFLAAGVIISILRPGPSEIDVMRFMEGMMNAMDRSLMGVAMGIESDMALLSIIKTSTSLLIPIITGALVLGFAIRFSQRRDRDV